MGWLIALGVLILLACLPLGVSGAYGEAGAQLQLILGPVRLQLYPGKGKKEKKEKTPKEQQKKSAVGRKSNRKRAAAFRISSRWYIGCWTFWRNCAGNCE